MQAVLEQTLGANLELVKAKNPELGYFTFVKYGSAANEKPGFHGISHLTEHLMCCAWDDMADYLSRHGITHNAYTSDFKIVYHFSGLDEHLVKAIEFVLFREGERNIRNWTPSGDLFERERGVVLQEYETWMSTPYNSLLTNINRKHFNYNGAIGLDVDLKSITYDEFLPFFKTQQQFDHFAYSGNSLDRVRCLCEHRAIDRNQPATKIYSLMPTARQTVSDYVPQFPASNESTTLIGDWFELPDDVSHWEMKVLEQMWNEGASSAPLMKVLRYDMGLAYAAYLTTINTLHKVFMSYVTVNPANVEQARDALHNTIVGWKQYITPERFNDIVRYMHLQLDRSGAENYKDGYMSRFSTPEKRLLTHKKLDSITYERVCGIHERCFVRGNINIAEAGKVMVV